MHRAIAITGMGMVTAQGVGVDATWRGVVEGREVLRPWEAVAGTALGGMKVALCGDLPRAAGLPGRFWKKLSRTQQLAALAVEEALAKAALPGRLEGMRAGVFLATTVCGMDQNERFYAGYRENREGADVELMRRLMPFEAGAFVARRHRARWLVPQVCLTTCVGSAMAMANAVDAIAQGECDVVIAGGAEAICRLAQTKDFPAVTGNITIGPDRNAIKPAVVMTIKDGKFQLVKRITP